MKTSVKRKSVSGEVLSMNELMAEWACGQDLIRKAIDDGMPHRRKDSGEFEFNLKECQEWCLHGYFDSLKAKDKRSIINQFKVVQ